METIKEIVAEMRKRFEPYAKSDSNDARYVAYLGYAEFADRIEAATKREKAQFGNAAAMREALRRIGGLSKTLLDRDCDEVNVNHRIQTEIASALAKPLRNCDIGTAEEQGFRFDEFCRSHWGKNGMLGDNCEHCPLDRFNCRLEWAQMPYEEGEDK